MTNIRDPIVSMVECVHGAAFSVVRLFDEGGSLIGLEKGTETLGEPLKIKTWTHFYKRQGSQSSAAVAALVAAFYISGCVHGYVANAADPPPPPPVTTKKGRAAKGEGARGKATERQPVAGGRCLGAITVKRAMFIL